MTRLLTTGETNLVLLALRVMQDLIENSDDYYFRGEEYIAQVMDDLEMEGDVPHTDDINRMCERINTGDLDGVFTTQDMALIDGCSMKLVSR